ncbi:MAG TPA: serine/threonine-protein kinase [Kofleriaceae bacterium]|nr:serine/threonine-protein kinase [Kofleriaceae bacterium]
MTLGHYEIVRKLAIGGMGEVYLAHQTGPVDFRRHVVLKRLHPRFTNDPQFVAMFLNEAQIAANLAHPNIIHIYELFQEGEGYVIAMEYVRGGTVLSLLRAQEGRGGSGLPYGPIVRIATAMCDALYYAYNEPDADGVPRRVIHRDISPSNVLVGYDGQAKLADFGIAKALESENATQATTIKGKYGYLTPEQIRCEPLDQRNDVFSLGTMLWEMSVGSTLFQRESEMQMMYAILEEDIPRPSQRVPGYPPDLERVVMKALARARDDRYTDAHALAEDLIAVARSHGWDCEKSGLARLVKDLLPDDQIAFGRFGSDLPVPEPEGEPSQRRMINGSWVDADSFASMQVIGAAARGGSSKADVRQWLTRGSLWTIAILLAASAVFWIWIVPLIDP